MITLKYVLANIEYSKSRGPMDYLKGGGEILYYELL
jgi:hypothetical protein